MDPQEVVTLAGIGINALLSIIAKLKGQAGMTDDQIMAAVDVHGPQTKAAIAGYLAALPPAA